MESGKLLPWQAKKMLQEYFQKEMGPALNFLSCVGKEKWRQEDILFHMVPDRGEQ